MKFGICKCAVLTLIDVERVKQPNKERIRDPGNSEYKYFGILKLDNIVHRGIEDITAAYAMRLKLVLKLKFYEKNLVTTNNIWVLAVVFYSATVAKIDVKEIDRHGRFTRI